MCMFRRLIFSMSKCRGTISKTLLISIATIMVRFGGLALKPDRMSWVKSVSNVVVECFGLNPCCCWTKGSEGDISLSISFSKSLETVDKREIGLYEEGCFGSLFGLSIGMMMACFQKGGIVLCVHAWLSISVNVWMAVWPRCLRCKLEILSGPSALEFLRDFIATDMPCVEKEGGARVSIFCFLRFLMIFLLFLWVGLKLILEKWALSLGLGILLLQVRMDS